jgi:hypothetical protein
MPLPLRNWIGVCLLTVSLPAGALAQDASTRIVNDPERGELGILIGPVDLPAMPGMEHAHMEHMMVRPPVATVRIPVDAYLYGFRYDVVDADGKPVPTQVVHHLNLIDPDHRELFLPISQRIGAVGGETGAQEMPWAIRYLFGVPVTAGQRVVVSAMMHNPTGKDYHGVTLRYYWKYVKGHRPWPFFALEPFQLDVAFPAGDKSFALPPGKFSKSYEGKPSVPGRILAIGGHLHELATSLKFEDVTAKTTIWEGKPYTDEHGNVNRLAIGYLYKQMGVKLESDHLYRVTVSYDNPSKDTIPAGGMGVVAGVFLPAAPWPATDTTDQLYALDRKHYLREVSGTLSEILAQQDPPAAAKKLGAKR